MLKTRKNRFPRTVLNLVLGFCLGFRVSCLEFIYDIVLRISDSGLCFA
jgi:hypothetical protein